MTEQEINERIERIVQPEPLFAVEKGDWYYRPGGHGYTNRLEEAGRYTEQEAKAELVRGEPMRIVPFPPRNYCGSLDDMRLAEKKLLLTYHRVNVPRSVCTNEANSYRAILRGVCERDGDDHTIHASARHRAEAFLRLFNQW